MTASAEYPQPLLSLGAAIAVMGLLCAHRYRLLYGQQDTRSNALVLALRGSTSGKNHPRTCAMNTLDRIGVLEFTGIRMASVQALEDVFGSRFAKAAVP